MALPLTSFSQFELSFDSTSSIDDLSGNCNVCSVADDCSVDDFINGDNIYSDVDANFGNGDVDADFVNDDTDADFGNRDPDADFVNDDTDADFGKGDTEANFVNDDTDSDFAKDDDAGFASGDNEPGDNEPDTDFADGDNVSGDNVYSSADFASGDDLRVVEKDRGVTRSSNSQSMSSAVEPSLLSSSSVILYLDSTSGVLSPFPKFDLLSGMAVINLRDRVLPRFGDLPKLSRGDRM